MKIYSLEAGHMAAMRIHGKNPLKFFFHETSGPITMKVGMKHQGIKSIIVYSYGDLS